MEILLLTPCKHGRGAGVPAIISSLFVECKQSFFLFSESKLILSVTWTLQSILWVINWV